MNKIPISLVMLMLLSCHRNTDNFPSVTCQESYQYQSKTFLNFNREQRYKSRGDTKWATIYNPMTGVFTFVKFPGIHRGVNKARMYNDLVRYELICR